MIQDAKTTSSHTEARARIVKAGCLAFLLICVVVVLSHIHGNEISLDKSESLQVIHGPEVTFMGSDTLNKGYNFLRGAGADPRYARSIGQFTLKMAKSLEYGGTVYYQPDQVDLTMNAGCESNSGSRSAETTSSSSSVTSYAQSKSKSFAVQAKVSGKAPFLPISGSVGGGVAATYGKSQSALNAQAYAKRGYMSSSESWVRSTLFNAYIDWKSEHKLPNGSRLDFGYEPEFLTHANAINSAPWPSKLTEKRVMELFERWGTHVIGEATYGSQCSSTLFMQAIATSRSTAKVARAAGSSRLAWNAYAEASYGAGSASVKSKGSTSSSFKATSSTKGATSLGMKYEIGNVRCEGHIKDNLCDKNFGGAEDNPVMIEYTPVEIWSLKKDEAHDVFSTTGRANIVNTLKNIGERLKACREQQCDGGGFCVMSSSFWESVREGSYSADNFKTDLSYAFDKSCLCANGAAGGVGCKFGKEQLAKMESMASQSLSMIVLPLEAAPASEPWYGITKQFYDGTGDRFGLKMVTFKNNKKLCSEPRIALGWSRMDGRFPLKGYDVSLSVQAHSTTSTSFGLRLGALHGVNARNVGLAYFATCDPRIEIGSRDVGEFSSKIKSLNHCKAANRKAWIGISVLRTPWPWIWIAFNPITATVYGSHSHFSNKAWSILGWARIDYAAWCADDIPANELQSGQSVASAFGSPKMVPAYFNPPMNCETPGIIFSIIHVAAAKEQVAHVYVNVGPVSRFGVEFTFVPTHGSSYHGVYINWLAHCY